MKAISAVILLALVAGAVPIAFAWKSAFAPVDPPPPASFDRASIMRGAQLALIGNCNVCHTAPSGPAYAGLRPVHTAFGTIYATNITPDPETGIGRWSEAAFTRAMREGVDRRGRHLYPAFPYDHFTKASDEDLKSLYAFLMTREPVRAEAPANPLPFPLNLRPLIAAWKWLFFEPSRFEPDPAQSAELTRGAYLVQSLGHCGACHTPRNVLGAEKKTQFLSGGEAGGWDAPALNAASPSPRAWTADSLYRYLRHGMVEQHGIPAGPMAPAVHNLAAAADDDVRAIASYIASLMPAARPEREKSIDALIASIQRPEPGAGGGAQPAADPQSLRQGELLYQGACAFCHDQGRQVPSSGEALYLPLSTALYLPTPRNLIRIVSEGIAPPDGAPGRWMPAFEGVFTDEQLAALAIYLRARYTDAPAWTKVGDVVRKARK